MAQIDTSLIMASVPQMDIAGTIGSAIQGYYGVKEMENSLKEQNMLLEQRENELWSSNYDKWKEYGNFVTPDNIDDYISKGKEMGIYDDEDAKAMRESFDDMGGVGYFDELRGKMETASGHQKAISDLEAEKAQLASQAEELGGLDTPIAYQQQEQINQRVAEIDNEIAQNMEPLKGLNPNALMQEYQAANEAIQGRMSIWRGMGNAEQAIKAGDVVTRYRRNPETGEVEAMTAYTANDLDGLYENDYIYEDSSDVPTEATEEEEKQLTTGVGPSGVEERVLIGKETGQPTWTGVKTGEFTAQEKQDLANVTGKDAKDFIDKNTAMNGIVADFDVPAGATDQMLSDFMLPENRKIALNNWVNMSVEDAMMGAFTRSELNTMSSRIASQLKIPASDMEVINQTIGENITELSKDGSLTPEDKSFIKSLLSAYINELKLSQIDITRIEQ